MTDIKPWCAPCSIRFYPEGKHCTNPRNGDVLLVNHGTFLAKCITAGELIIADWSQKELKGYTWLDHCALIIMAQGKEVLSDGTIATTGEWLVSELGPRGHELRTLRDYQDRLYCVVDFEVSVWEREQVISSDRRLWGIEYGFIQYPFLMLNGLTGAKIAASYGDSMICSTALTWACQNVYFTPDRQASSMIPSHIAKLVGAKHD